MSKTFEQGKAEVAALGGNSSKEAPRKTILGVKTASVLTTIRRARKRMHP